MGSGELELGEYAHDREGVLVVGRGGRGEAFAAAIPTVFWASSSIRVGSASRIALSVGVTATAALRTAARRVERGTSRLFP